ncbi:uncharacterized protein [Hetaerina americana]|uniref:uncharacterized protein isoform X1 n=1 Tax=Hetaerina americana TaxID=62018 RepID=UPI003A7F1122
MVFTDKFLVPTMSLESKIQDLQARLDAENKANRMDNLPKDLSHVSPNPRHGTSRRPRQLGDLGGGSLGRADGTGGSRPRKQLVLPVSYMAQQRGLDGSGSSSGGVGGDMDGKLQEIMKMNGILVFDSKEYHTEIEDLEHLGELGNGTCGHVVKMLHRPSQTIIAVKQMRRSGNSEENKRVIMDLEVVLKSHDCPFIVRCLGCFIAEADVWICMELMATCFDKLLRRLKPDSVPESILGKVTVATVKALHYLKESHGVIHRDVKPSNILLDERGNVKLCDFGISGRLVDSKAKTRSAGCAAYMAPERIDPPDPTRPDYDIRADVWSLGITLVELATGQFPYQDCRTDFEVLTRVLQDDPPRLPKSIKRAGKEGDGSDDSETSYFSPEFHSFVTCCLTKNYKHRPKYRKLLEHPFIKKYETAPVDVADWFARAMKQCGEANSSSSLTVTTTVANSTGSEDAGRAGPPPQHPNSATTTSSIQRFTPTPGASPMLPRRRGTSSPYHHQRSLSETPRPVSGDSSASSRPSPPPFSASNNNNNISTSTHPDALNRLSISMSSSTPSALPVSAFPPQHHHHQQHRIPHHLTPPTGRKRYPSEPHGNNGTINQQQLHRLCSFSPPPQAHRGHHHLHHFHHHSHPHHYYENHDVGMKCAEKEDDAVAGKKRFAANIKFQVPPPPSHSPPPPPVLATHPPSHPQHHQMCSTHQVGGYRNDYRGRNSQPVCQGNQPGSAGKGTQMDSTALQQHQQQLYTRLQGMVDGFGQQKLPSPPPRLSRGQHTASAEGSPLLRRNCFMEGAGSPSMGRRGTSAFGRLWSHLGLKLVHFSDTPSTSPTPAILRREQLSPRVPSTSEVRGYQHGVKPNGGSVSMPAVTSPEAQCSPAAAAIALLPLSIALPLHTSASTQSSSS